MNPDEVSTVQGEGESAQWPKVVGVIGIVIGVLTIFDQLSDLAVPFYWTEDYLVRWFQPEIAQLIIGILPPAPWLIASALIGLALGILVLIASIRLKNHVRSGVRLTIRWAWLVIAWVVAEGLLKTGLLVANADRLAALRTGEWEIPVAISLPLALAVTCAYPAFLLFWFKRPDVRKEYMSWGISQET